MNKESIINTIKEMEPNKEIESLIEFPNLYTYRMVGEESGWFTKCIDKETGS